MSLTLTHVKSNTIADFTGTVTVMNSAGTTATALATDLVRPSDWNSNHIFKPDGFFEPFLLPNTNSTLSAPGIGTWYLDPIFLPHGMDSGRLNVFVSNAAGFLHGTTFSAANTGSVTRYQTLHNKIALYQQGTGANASRLETVWTGANLMYATWEKRVSNPNTSNVTVSNYLTLSFLTAFDTAGGSTYGSTSQSGTTSVGASTAASTVANNLITGAVAYVSGARRDGIPFNTSVPPGQYWLAHMFYSTSSSTGTNYSQGTMFSTQSRLGLLENAIGAYKLPGNSVSSSNSQPVMFHGYLATTSSDASSVIATSDVIATTGRMYWNHQRSN